ncbi:uncharacterized protein LOC127529352 [Erpetoichthys calabaricus]|uniref:uncharacterized protein LOC127529352 n=1 Tax=Erpetoichthys calabaricus TaxID=27687 RepID=UPI00223435AD|nr:uncharacterized protein LOC127529352 [Erpetoichthys calabaricus]
MTQLIGRVIRRRTGGGCGRRSHLVIRCPWRQKMDAKSLTALSSLYRTDPLYSRCAADLMSASHKVIGVFLKEQADLTQTLKKLEHQKVTRIRQLNEEKKQFAQLMRKRLAPGKIYAQAPCSRSAFCAERTGRSVFSAAPDFSSSGYKKSRGSSSKSVQSDFLSHCGFGNKSSDSLVKKMTVLPAHSDTSRVKCVCECGCPCKLIQESASSLPAPKQL